MGAQCADVNSSFDCDVQFQTDKCNTGWKCQHDAKANTSQCVQAIGGQTDKKACEQQFVEVNSSHGAGDAVPSER